MGSRRPLFCASGLGLWLFFASACAAYYIFPALKRVPVERLVTNLERVVEKAPKNVDAVINLARVHGMAYALKSDSIEVPKDTERRSQMRKLARPITPIALPLRDRLEARHIEDRGARVALDVDGSRLKRSWTWITRNAGWLVYDPKNEGGITSGLQLFGGVTFWLFWQTGYGAPAALDDNRDGELRGNELTSLAIWHDSRNPGVSDPGEVQPLSAYGIAAVSCRFELDSSHSDQVAYSPAGVTFRDGRTRASFDVILKPGKRRER